MLHSARGVSAPCVEIVATMQIAGELLHLAQSPCWQAQADAPSAQTPPGGQRV